MPVMTELHTLWLNHNEITNLGKKNTVHILQEICQHQILYIDFIHKIFNFYIIVHR